MGRATSLFQAVLDTVGLENIPLEKAIQTITASPAKMMNWQDKGEIEVGRKADVLIYNEESKDIETVIAKGKVLKRGNTP